MTILTTIQQWINQFSVTTDRPPTASVVERQLIQLNWQSPIFYITDASGQSVPLRFRWGQMSDIDQLMQLQNQAYQGYTAWHALDFEKDLSTNPYRVYLLAELIDEATDEPVELVGAITGRCQHIKGHISHLMVQPAYQQVGLGKYLLSQWLEMMCLLDVQRVELEVAESNKRALNLYQRYGFKKGRKLVNYYQDQGHAYRMIWYNQGGGGL